MVNEEFIGNFTSIVKTVLLAVAGYFIGYCVSIGFNLPISAEQLSEVLFMVLCLVWSYFDMKYPMLSNGLRIILLLKVLRVKLI